MLKFITLSALLFALMACSAMSPRDAAQQLVRAPLPVETQTRSADCRSNQLLQAQLRTTLADQVASVEAPFAAGNARRSAELSLVALETRSQALQCAELPLTSSVPPPPSALSVSMPVSVPADALGDADGFDRCFQRCRSYTERSKEQCFDACKR